ncbi:hypothetical protein CSA37_07685 [Candidatus Fermentibacteria bacterium]|nr:MAG: hypothetical protein CSA37_07685 [Candidatus Fermentibacteria bacterium]
MNRLAVVATLLLFIAGIGCGPDNPFEPDPPSPSALTALLSGGDTAKLSWTTCPDSDFQSYTLYRSASPGIESKPNNAEIVTVINKLTTTVYYDSGVSGTLYYVLKTTNEENAVSWSNEVSVKAPL